MTEPKKPAEPEKPAKEAEKKDRAARFVTPGEEIKVDKKTKTVTI